jgi:hypothetical protein
MRREAVVEVGGVGVRFIEEEGRVLVSTSDVLQMVGFKNPSATWGEVQGRIEEAWDEARRVRFETKLPGKRQKLTVLPPSNMADVLLDFKRTTTGYDAAARKEALDRGIDWLMKVQPFEAQKAQTPPPPSVTPTPKPEERKATPPPPKVEVPTGGDLILHLEGGDYRVTPDGQRMAVYDLIKGALGVENPRVTWADLCARYPEVVGFSYDFQFPGQGQRPTPTVDREGFARIMLLLPGQSAARFREKVAPLILRYMDGEEINARVAAAPTPKQLPQTPSEAALAISQQAADILDKARAAGVPEERLRALSARLVAVNVEIAVRSAEEAAHAATLEECCRIRKDIGDDCGISSQRVSQIARELGLMRGPWQDVPGLSRWEWYAVPNSGPGHREPMPRFSPKAERAISEHCEKEGIGKWSPVKAASAGDRPSRVARVGAGDKGEVFTRLDDDDPAE